MQQHISWSRRRCRRSLSAVVAVGLTSLVASASAQAWVTTDVVDWNLTEQAATIGAYSVSNSGDGTAAFRWLDSPSKTTVVSGNNCSDISVIPPSPRTIGAGDTEYFGLFSRVSPGFCFLLRGRTAIGSGTMNYFDGRVRR